MPFNCCSIWTVVLRLICISTYSLLLIISGQTLAESYGADTRGTIQISFAGLKVSGISEYPQFGLTRYRIQSVIKEEWSAANGQVTLENLQNIAGTITSLYRQAGFVFTRAYIPQQRSTDGVVEIRLLEGYLEAVDVYDNKDFDKELIRSAFEPLIGKVIVSADVEEAMALTNDLPGLNVFGFYSVGEQLGGTRINIRVREEKQGSGAVRVDNYGSELTGKGRFLVEWESYSVISSGDSLRLGVLQTFDPDNATYGLLDFRTTIGNPGNTAGFSASANDYVLGRGRSDIGQLDISGETRSAGFNFSHKLIRSSANTQVLSLSLNWDESRSVSDAFPEVYDLTTESWDMAFSYHIDLQNRKQRRWRTISVELKPGLYVGGNPAGQSDDFWLLRFSSAVGRFFKPLQNGGYHKLITRAVGQYSEHVLPPDEQFPLGGAGSLRGFEPGQFSADSGFLFSVEWLFPNFGFGGSMEVTPGVFVDYGYGVQRVKADGLNDDWASLADVGMALNFAWGSDLGFSLSAAKPIADSISYSDEPIDDVQVYGELTWRFF